MKALLIMVAMFVGGSLFAQTPRKTVTTTYKLNYDKEEWSNVLKWIEKESGLTFIDTVIPNGTLTLKSDKELTLFDVFNLLDEELERQGLNFYRRSLTFLVVPSDERLPETVHIAEITELPSFLNSARVQIILPITGQDSEAVAANLKPLLSKVGSLTPFGSDQILVYDKAKNLRQIVEFLKTEDQKKPDANSMIIQPMCLPQAAIHVHKCAISPRRKVFECLRGKVK